MRFARFNRLLGTVALCAVVLVGAGCGKQTTQPSTPQPDLIVVAIDRSESTRPMRGAQFDALDLLATVAIADNVPLDVWAFDSDAVRVWGPRVPASRQDLLPVKQAEIAPSDAKYRHLTRPARVLEELASDPVDSTKRHVLLVLLTDGDDDDYEDSLKLASASADLSQRSIYQVAILGIAPENRKAWETALTPAFGDRYTLAGPSEISSALHGLVSD